MQAINGYDAWAGASIMASALSSAFLNTPPQRRDGRGSRAVRCFCFSPDRLSQTLDALPDAPKLAAGRSPEACSRASSLAESLGRVPTKARLSESCSFCHFDPTLQLASPGLIQERSSAICKAGLPLCDPAHVPIPSQMRPVCVLTRPGASAVHDLPSRWCLTVHWTRLGGSVTGGMAGGVISPSP